MKSFQRDPSIKGRDRKFEQDIVDYTGDEYLREMFEALDRGLCPFCQKEVNFEDFQDMESIKEYGISGICGPCQNKFFSKKLKNF